MARFFAFFHALSFELNFFFRPEEPFKLIHFSEKSDRLSSTGSKILAFGSYYWANFQPILDCFVPKFSSSMTI